MRKQDPVFLYLMGALFALLLGPALGDNPHRFEGNSLPEGKFFELEIGVDVQINREDPVEIIAIVPPLMVRGQIVVLVNIPPPVEQLIEFTRDGLLFFYFEEVALFDSSAIFERALKNTEIAEDERSARVVLGRYGLALAQYLTPLAGGIVEHETNLALQQDVQSIVEGLVSLEKEEVLRGYVSVDV